MKLSINRLVPQRPNLHKKPIIKKLKTVLAHKASMVVQFNDSKYHCELF